MKIIITVLIFYMLSVSAHAQLSWKKAGDIASKYNITENGVTLDQQLTYDMGKKMMTKLPEHPFAIFDQVIASRNYTAKDIVNAPQDAQITTKSNGDVKTVKGCKDMKELVVGLRRNLTGGNSTNVANYIFEFTVAHFNSISPRHVRYYQKGWSLCVRMDY
ncbi:hypothetical protein ABXT70_00820 [Candidatus Njordibacter sp. Uisw_039]|jgi:hypothetical protein|uniref:hypothetical protein n=1 Tax=Candidatus Njordibacter sp. Uisw_039 TaxID=3230972 RepID=UPI003D599B23